MIATAVYDPEPTACIKCGVVGEFDKLRTATRQSPTPRGAGNLVIDLSGERNMNAQPLNWFALRVAPLKEEVACTILRRQNYVAEIPTEARLRRKTRYCKMRQEIRYPILRGFIFVGFTTDHIEWFRILRLHLINNVVSVNGRPAKLNTEAVEKFLNFQSATNPQYYKALRTGAEFAIGDTVWINQGVLEGREMRVHDIDPKSREAIFLLPLLGQEQRVGVSIDSCQKAA